MDWSTLPLRELRELKERQDRARLSCEAPCRPEMLAFLDEHFERLAPLDPERHIRMAIARHPLFAITDAIATFHGKRDAGTPPDGADARYLLGVVRNIAAQADGQAIARRLLELRLEARDRKLRPLVVARDALRASSDAALVVSECVDRALSTASPLDRTFCLDTLADAILAQDENARDSLYLAAARRIESTFAIPAHDRHEAVCRVAARYSTCRVARRPMADHRTDLTPHTWDSASGLSSW